MKQEVLMPTPENLSEENRNEPTGTPDEAPRAYSFRSQVSTTVKLLVISGSVLALLWMLDRFVAR